MISPPTDMQTPHTMNIVTTVGIALVVLGMLVAAVRVWRSSGDRTGVYMLAGGVLCSLNEPLVDVIGRCYFPEKGGWIVYHMFDRPMPVWLILAYVLYFGGLAWIASHLVRNGLTRASMYRALGAFAVVNVILELPNLQQGLYVYYGPQPFEVAGFPLAWLTINLEGALLGAFVVVKLVPLLTGARQALLILVPVSTYFCSWIIAMPHFWLINTDAPTAVKWAGSAVTMGLGLVFIRFLVLNMTPEPAPARAMRAPAVAVPAR